MSYFDANNTAETTPTSSNTPATTNPNPETNSETTDTAANFLNPNNIGSLRWAYFFVEEIIS